MLVPRCAEHDYIIEIRTRIVQVVVQGFIHQPLESSWCSVQTKGHSSVLEFSPGRAESSFGFGLWSRSNDIKCYLCKRRRDDWKRLKGCTLMCVWSCLLALWTCLAKLLPISSESRPREVVPDLGMFFFLPK